MKRRTIFDCETRPLPDDKLIKPVFEANKTLKDPDKIKANLAEKEAEWRSRLALDATTCRVAMIGLLTSEGEETIIEGDERDILNDWWTHVSASINAGYEFVGFNCYNFDLNILVRRSYAHGIRIPFPLIRNGRYWCGDVFVDLMERWSLGNREQRISLDNLALFLGVMGKDHSEPDFDNMTTAQLKAHLQLDLKITKECAERLL